MASEERAVPEVFIELRPSRDGCYVNGRIVRAADRRPRVFGGVYDSRAAAISEATSWALGWLKRLRESEHERITHA
jgi:hypothetical protein